MGKILFTVTTESKASDIQDAMKTDTEMVLDNSDVHLSEDLHNHVRLSDALTAFRKKSKGANSTNE